MEQGVGRERALARVLLAQGVQRVQSGQVVQPEQEVLPELLVEQARRGVQEQARRCESM